MAYNSDVAVNSITFHGDGAFEITYAEQSEITANVMILRQISVAPGVVSSDDALSEVRELLDAALGKMHEAPDEIIRRH